MLHRLARHLRAGTLLERVQVWFGRMPEFERVHWFGADNPAQAARALARCGQLFLAGGAGWVLVLGDGGEFHQSVKAALERRGVPYQSHGLDDVLAWQADRLAGLKGIVCAYAEAASQTRAARALATHPLLAPIPFEYAPGINRERAQFARRDEYATTHFVAPSLLDSPTPYELYEESLTRFEQKCGLRDYLDLYQVLKHVVVNDVPGDIAEFGSYKGHSGWLIARTLQALKSSKRVWLFDMFEAFPQESVGMDHFWSRTHQVDFAEVRGKFAGMPNVTLVKGDFTQTLEQSGVGALALAYVDCDSYRATRHLIRVLWQRYLSPRAALVCEDYGHPALLGNRAAVHEELDHLPGVFRFFSQFSGLYIALKT